jgi:hypothetical protein
MVAFLIQASTLVNKFCESLLEVYLSLNTVICKFLIVAQLNASDHELYVFEPSQYNVICCRNEQEHY